MMNLLKKIGCILALLLLSACNPSAVVTPQVKVVTIDAKEFAYIPTRLSVRVGETIQIEIKNTGSTLHDFSIQKIAIKDQAKSVGDGHEGGHDGMGGMAMETAVVHVAANAGKTGTVTFTPTETGEYEFFCTVEGHKAAGMVGKLIVVS